MRSAKLLTVFSLIALVCCSHAPQAINYGKDSCENCLMTITDPRYGSELITDKGKIYKFDSIECLATYSQKKGLPEISSMWVTDFSGQTKFVNVIDALFIKSDNLRSPMGLNLTAFSSNEDFQSALRKFDGQQLTWNDLLEYVRESWSD